MVDLIEDIKANPIVYYVGLLIGLALLSLIIYLIVRNERKKKARIRERIEEKSRVERHVDLEAMIAQMQEQEQDKLKDVDPVANFEQEQEEKAIISYQELVNAVSNDNKEPISVTSVSSDGDVLATTNVSRKALDEQPIFIDEVKLPKSDIEFDPEEEEIATPTSKIPSFEDLIDIKFEPKSNNDMIEEAKPAEVISEIKEVIKEEPRKTGTNKFKRSEFISPIYGRQNSSISYPKISSFKSDDNEEEDIITISDDVDPNTEFLNTLRQYRN